MPRTSEQINADDALTQAILQVREAYADPSGDVVLTDYIVIYAVQGWDEDGDDVGGVNVLLRDGTIPNYRILGLVESVAAECRAFQTRVAEEEDD